MEGITRYGLRPYFRRFFCHCSKEREVVFGAPALLVASPARHGPEVVIGLTTAVSWQRADIQCLVHTRTVQGAAAAKQHGIVPFGAATNARLSRHSARVARACCLDPAVIRCKACMEPTTQESFVAPK
jgi:hypothetical protein